MPNPFGLQNDSPEIFRSTRLYWGCIVDWVGGRGGVEGIEVVV